MHLYYNGYDYYVAENTGQLNDLVLKVTGLPADDEDNVGDGWEVVDPSRKLTLHDEDDSGAPRSLTRTAAEWAACQPPGYIGGQEW